MAAQSIKAMIDPKDIAALAVFLASDAAKSISGQVRDGFACLGYARLIRHCRA